ncbi:hypothetical protein Tco_1294128 [Tanacetum coccineum]
MTNSHQQAIADVVSETRPLMLEKGSYVPWILNDIYNSVDACQTAQTMWTWVRRLMQGTDLSKQETNSRLTNEFDKFTSVVIIARQQHKLLTVEYDVLYDHLKQHAVIVNASRAKRATKAHDPLALVAHTYVGSSHSHSQPLQDYYVIHPPSVNEFEDAQSYDIKGEVISDDQINKLTTTMMLLALAITQHYSTPTNNLLCTSSNTSNQAYVEDGKVDVQSKNVGNGGTS